MPKVLNSKDTSLGIYVGRPTKWGNPFIIGELYTREESVAMYRKWLQRKTEEGALHPEELKGFDLRCWCAPLLCHADVLLEVSE